MQQIIEVARARLLYLPKYSPDLNPIEQAFSKLKAFYVKLASKPSTILVAGFEKRLVLSPQQIAKTTSQTPDMLLSDRNPL